MSVKTIHLTHVYSPDSVFEFKALDDINVSVNKGEFIGLIGHTGSGKSTFVQHINRLLWPTEGEVHIDDVNIDDKTILMKDICKKIGVVFQYPEQQLFEETVFLDVAFGPKNLGFSGEELESLVKDAIESVGLNYKQIKDSSPFELSGGQKRRVAIAGVLAMKPEILVLDEPASGLDPKGKKAILDKIKNLHEKKHLTVFLVSHNMDDVAQYAERIMIFDKGKLYQIDTKENVFKNAAALKEIGLTVPQSKQLMLLLKDAGFNVDTNIYTLDAAEKEILRIVNEGGRKC